MASQRDASATDSRRQVIVRQPIVVQSGAESEQLAQLDEHLVELKEQSAAAEERREEEQAQEAAQHEATLEALDVLRQAEESLAIGHSDGVDDQLARAEAALSGRTRLDVEAAREALSRSDLYPARGFLAAALAERRTVR